MVDEKKLQEKFDDIDESINSLLTMSMVGNKTYLRLAGEIKELKKSIAELTDIVSHIVALGVRTSHAEMTDRNKIEALEAEVEKCKKNLN